MKGALRDFLEFPEAVQDQISFALRAAARREGGYRQADEGLRLRRARDRPCGTGETPSGAVYAVQLDADVWVLHAFQKKSRSGIKMPRQEIDVVHERVKRLKEQLR